MLRDEAFELADELSAAAQLEIGVDPFLQGLQPELLEAADLALGEALESEVAERWAPPQRERLAQQPRPLLCVLLILSFCAPMLAIAARPPRATLILARSSSRA